MDSNELMTIGRFARLSGVSVHALRHYDDVGLLMPAEIDADSGYRRYRADQIRRARLILALRWADLPLEGIRVVLDGGDDREARAVLARHRDRLERQSSRLSAQIRDVTRVLERGLAPPAVQSGSRPVQIRIAVGDKPAAVSFYQALLGASYQVTQRTSEADFSAFQFGEYGRDDFFLLWLLDDHQRLDLPGRSNVGFSVDDLDAAHRRALAAGAREAVAPRETAGMPRHSAVTDPSGNWIGLFQGGNCSRPVQLMIGVDDAQRAAEFYSQAFRLSYQAATQMPEQDSPAFQFGEYGRDDFFLLGLLDDPGRLDWPGRANFSLLVDDLDTVHLSALAAGATEIAAPHDTEGMPRNSAVADPSGNWIGLAQG